MRACFLGKNVCTLGYGVALLQTPRLEEKYPLEDLHAPVPPSEGEKLAAPRPNPMFAALKGQPHFL